MKSKKQKTEVKLDFEGITNQEKSELKELAQIIYTEAINVKLDYEQNPSDMPSGSIVQVHEDSSILKE
jgi:hypothetical protein